MRAVPRRSPAQGHAVSANVALPSDAYANLTSPSLYPVLTRIKRQRKGVFGFLLTRQVFFISILFYKGRFVAAKPPPCTFKSRRFSLLFARSRFNRRRPLLPRYLLRVIIRSSLSVVKNLEEDMLGKRTTLYLPDKKRCVGRYI